jgi:hypothetical protein
VRRGRLIAIALALAACSSGQHEVTAGDLLTTSGELREPGWSPKQLQTWDPSRVADPTKLRQWDFFTIMNEKAAVNLTLGDLGIDVATVSTVDLTTGATDNAVLLGQTSELSLSGALGEDAALTPSGGSPALAYANDASTGDTVATIDLPSPIIGDPVTGSITIHRRPTMPYLSDATPFDELATYFFYEQKVPGMTAEGTITIGATSWTFDASDTIAVMDWGRGEWPHLVTWRWASGSGTIDGKPFAFNLGEGFGNDRDATENVVFYDDTPCKLGRVTWTFDPQTPTGDWTFASDDGRLSLVLHPLEPELSDLNLGAKSAHLVKAYGHVTGTVTIAGGRKLAVGGVLAAAEQEDITW